MSRTRFCEENERLGSETSYFKLLCIVSMHIYKISFEERFSEI